MTDAITKFKIKDLGVTDKQYKGMVFGRRLEYARKIRTFQETARKTHVSQKHVSHAKAWREFLDLYKPDQYYTVFHDSTHCRDDSFEVWFTVLPLSMEAVKKLQAGDQVKWNDPKGVKSRYLNIESIVVEGEIITIIDVDGTMIQCYAHELE